MSAQSYWGVLAEFSSPATIFSAAERTTDAGYTKVDAHTPFPVHGLDGALRQGPSHLGWFVCLGGLIGIVSALLLMWWTNAYDYPTWVSGKPPWAWESTIPVTFELMVLLSALVAVFGMLALNRLPRLYHPIFKHSTVHRVSNDRFFLSIEAQDPKFDRTETVEFLRSLGGENVELLED